MMPLSPNALTQFYDSVAKTYDQFVEAADYAVPKWIQEHLNDLPKKEIHVVDLACGNGFLGKLLHSFGVRTKTLSGYDLSPQMIHQVRLDSIYTDAAVCDLAKGIPSNESNEADLILAFGLFEFIEDETATMKDVARILKSKGRLWCSFEAPSSDETVQTITTEYQSQPIRRFLKSETYIRNTLKKVGLSVLEISKSRGYVSPRTHAEIQYHFVRAEKP